MADDEVARMKYYDVEKMREIRDELEKEILKWPRSHE